MNGDAISSPVANSDERLEREVQRFLRLELVLELVRGGGIGVFEIAAAQPVIERDVGAADAFQVLEVGKGCGWLELVMDESARGECLHLVIDCGQLFVLRADELHCLLRNVRIARQDHRDRLADETHLAVRQDRLVVKCRAVIRIWNDLLDVVDGNDMEHTRQLFLPRWYPRS